METLWFIPAWFLFVLKLPCSMPPAMFTACIIGVKVALTTTVPTGIVKVLFSM